MVFDTDKLYFVSKCLVINNENKILILKRTNYKNDETNELWDFPGGSVNEDEDVNLAVIREVREESQIEIKNPKIFYIDSKKGIPSGQSIFTLFVSTDFEMKEGIKLSVEHSKYKWISIDEFDNYEFYMKENRLLAIKEYINKLD